MSIRERRLMTSLAWFIDHDGAGAIEAERYIANEFGLSLETAKEYVQDLEGRGLVEFRYGHLHLTREGEARLARGAEPPGVGADG